MVRIAVEAAGPGEDARVTPDVVQNRFGTVYGKYTLLELEDGGRSLFVPLHIEGREARLGLFLSPASTAGLEELCAFVFARFPVTRIRWDCSLSPLGHRYVRRNHPANHWKVLLPQTADELWSRMSRKSRYNRRREEKLLLDRLAGVADGADTPSDASVPANATDPGDGTRLGRGGPATADGTVQAMPDTGSAPRELVMPATAASTVQATPATESHPKELVMTEYDGAQNIPPAVVETFFSFKRKLMGREYGLSPAGYLAYYQVTNAYTWTYGERTVAIVFSCEQGQDVFLENLTYDPELEEFSPGFHLYALVLERLIQKGKAALFLGGGQQPYKSRFGGTEDACWNVEAYRSPLAALPSYAAKLAARIPGLNKLAGLSGGGRCRKECAPQKSGPTGNAPKERCLHFLKRGCRFVCVRSKWTAQKLFFSLVPVGHALNRDARPFSITLSLTSFPPRLATLHLCIKSLMRQTMKPDRIVLYLGADCEGVPLPKKLLALQKKGLAIRYVGGDLRPHKKYLYAMKDFPDDFIVTADDDLLYCRTLLADLWKAHETHPDALVASRVHLMKANGGSILPYRDWLHETGTVREPTHALLSTNGAGSLFPPHCLAPEALDEDLAARLCLNADDIWLKFMLIRGGTKVLWAGKRAGMPDEIRIRAEKKKALMDGNLTEGGNDGYIAALEKHFKMKLADYCG